MAHSEQLALAAHISCSHTRASTLHHLNSLLLFSLYHFKPVPSSRNKNSGTLLLTREL